MPQRNNAPSIPLRLSLNRTLRGRQQADNIQVQKTVNNTNTQHAKFAVPAGLRNSNTYNAAVYTLFAMIAGKN